jgi:hypothetical protein
MAVIFFYISIAAAWAALLALSIKRPPSLGHLLVAIAAIGYSLTLKPHWVNTPGFTTT